MTNRSRQHTDTTQRELIFDCDGTLADTMPLHWRAWQVITPRHKLHLPEDRFYALGGVPSRDILKMLSQEQGIPLDHLAVAREKEAEYLPLMAQVEPIKVVVAIVRGESRESSPGRCFRRHAQDHRIGARASGNSRIL